MIGYLMIVSVVIWAVLRLALFNVKKSKRLCACCVKCCPALTKCVQLGTKKLLVIVCPIALNLVMVLNNGLLLEDDYRWYAAHIDLYDIIFLISSLICFVVCVVLGVLGMVVSLFPACCVGMANLCGFKKCGSPLDILSSIVFSLIVVTLMFFTILGLIAAAIQLAEALTSGAFNPQLWQTFMMRLFMVPPDWRFGAPGMRLTLPIATLRIGKFAFITLPLCLDLFAFLIWFFGVATCRNWDKKFGKALDEIEDDLSNNTQLLEDAKDQVEALEAQLKALDEGSADHAEIQKKLEAQKLKMQELAGEVRKARMQINSRTTKALLPTAPSEDSIEAEPADVKIDIPAVDAKPSKELEESARKSVQDAGRKVVVGQIKEKIKPTVEERNLPWAPVSEAIDDIESMEDLQNALADPESFLEKCMSRGFVVAFVKRRLAMKAEERGLSKEKTNELLDEIDTVEELRAIAEDPSDFLTKVAKALGPILLKEALKAKLKPIVKKKKLPWKPVEHAIDQLLSIDDLQDAAMDPESFIKKKVKKATSGVKTKGSLGADLTGKDGRVVVSSVDEGSAAAKAGVVVDMFLISFNGADTTGMKKEEVTAKIKAATGKKRFAFSTDKDAKPSK